MKNKFWVEVEYDNDHVSPEKIATLLKSILKEGEEEWLMLVDDRWVPVKIKINNVRDS